MVITSRISTHRAARICPEINGPELDDLVDDIRTRGLIHPVRLLDGEVLDGRARLKACRRLGITPWFEHLSEDTDPFAYVVSANVHRRHLSVSQRAMVLAKLNRRGPEDLAQMRVSARSVQHAEKVVQSNSPALVEAVESGDMAVSLASRLADRPVTDQSEAIRKVREGRKREVTAALAPVPAEGIAPRPGRKEPAVEGSKQPLVPSPEAIVDLFRQTDCRIEAIRQLAAELQDHERELLGSLLGFDQPSTPEPPPPRVVEVEVETVKDRITDEMIASKQMAALKFSLRSAAAAVGAVRLLFATTDREAPRGDIGSLSDDMIADMCGWPTDSAGFVSALVQAGFLQRDNEHRLIVVDWEAHCLPETRKRLEETGEGFAEPTGVPKVKERKGRRVQSKDVNYTEAFEQFWSVYPAIRRKGKVNAFAAWKRALGICVPPEGVSVEQYLVQRATDYAKSWLGQSKFACGPEPWLNGGRWDDAPSAWEDQDTAYTAEFEQFWDAYPPMRRRSKIDAFAAWRNAISLAKPPEGREVTGWLIQRAGEFAKSVLGQSEFACSPEQWLSGGRWDDAPEVWRGGLKLQQEVKLQRVEETQHKPTPIPGIDQFIVRRPRRPNGSFTPPAVPKQQSEVS